MTGGVLGPAMLGIAAHARAYLQPCRSGFALSSQGHLHLNALDLP